MTESSPFDQVRLDAMNEKTIQNQFFTPDNVYMDIALFKDIPIGVIYADLIAKGESEDTFNHIQTTILDILPSYQKRRYDSVNEYFSKIHYSDEVIDDLLNNTLSHDVIFALSPSSSFLQTLIRHMMRNQNNSRPANKYVRKKIDDHSQTVEAIPVTYYINTYPLTLSNKILNPFLTEFGEAFGVNIKIINKNPTLFDQSDWDTWLEKIDCFYLDSLGRFTRGDFITEKQGDLTFMGCHFFARKRFETCVMHEVPDSDFMHQIQMMTARLDILCDFKWLPHNDVRLTEQKNIDSKDETIDPDGVSS